MTAPSRSRLLLIVPATLLALALVGAPGCGGGDMPGGGDGGTMDGSASDGGERDASVDGGSPDGGCPDTVCGSDCVDLDSDPRHCGSCDHDCSGLPGVNASAMCALGACVLDGACDPGLGDCDADPATGCETSMTTTTDCGACGTACVEPTPLCATAGGVSACASGCEGATPTRCGSTCVDTTTDPVHCGDCDTACPVPVGGTATCAASECGIACDDGLHACGDVCALNTDVLTCGTSCTPCVPPANALPTCDGTSCGFECAAGFADCDLDASNGCEIDTSADVLNCSACGMQCTIANGSARCAGSACAVDACTAGFADCNGLAGDGCEVDLTTDPSNCMACGLACSAANATAGCAGGLCTVAACNGGFADCNGLASDGCERSLTTDPMNCSACGMQCVIPNGTAGCSGAMCRVASCNAGFADCNGLAADGCERNITSDPMNCGSCGSSCFAANGTAGCAARMCTVASCNTGFGNCNGLPGDGCEVNLTNSVGNCGTCGFSCGATCTGNVTATSCSASACQITGCAAGYYNTDAVCSDGCECRSRGTSASCATPTAIGTVALGASSTYTGNLVPAGTVAYLSVTFAGNTSLAYHPRVRFTANPANEYAFDVLWTCGGSAACGIEGGAANTKTDWEQAYEAGTGGTLPIPPASVIVRVVRRAGAPVTCNNYTLTFSN